MGSQSQKKVRLIGEQDRLSSLPDEVIHKFMSYLDVKVAVQTGVLSKRWKLVWTTLPFLNFGGYEESFTQSTSNFLQLVLSNRNHQTHVSHLNLCVSDVLVYPLVEKFVKYAILYDLIHLKLDLRYYGVGYMLSNLSSNSLKKLTLCVKLEEFLSEADCWDLPALTYLHLVKPRLVPGLSSRNLHMLPQSCLTCLPALRTLCLDSWNITKSSFSFSLPDLTTLRMYLCTELPQKDWNFPALLSLELNDVDFPVNMSDIFPTLVNLQNLTLFLTRSTMKQHHSISCPELLNLNIGINRSATHYGDIKVLAPKLCNFTSLGILSISFEVPELENVKIKLNNWFWNMDWIYRKKYYPLFTNMLSGLGNTKNLTFDLGSMKALYVILDLGSLPSPFYKLKCVKLPQGYNESSISSALRSYLLGGSPRATIVTTVPQINMIPKTVALPMISQNVVLQEPLAAPTKELDGSQPIHQIPNVDTANIKQEEHFVGDSVLDADRVIHINSSGEEIGKDQVNSAMGNRDFGLWQGHKVNSEFVSLLGRIMHKYPETFEHFTTKNEKLCTMNLNMLCTSLNDFINISITEVDFKMIVEYKEVFAYLQSQGFNVSWVVCHLNHIELHANDCRVPDEKSKLQKLQAHVADAKVQLRDLQACVELPQLNCKTCKLFAQRS